MSKRTRSRTGARAKRRRARISRRLARADDIRAEMDYARWFFARAGSPAQVIGYDRRKKAVIVDVSRAAYALTITMTIGFEHTGDAAKAAG